MILLAVYCNVINEVFEVNEYLTNEGNFNISSRRMEWAVETRLQCIKPSEMTGTQIWIGKCKPLTVESDVIKQT